MMICAAPPRAAERAPAPTAGTFPLRHACPQIPFFSTLSNIIGAVSNVPIDFLLPALFFLQAARVVSFSLSGWELGALRALIGFSLLVSLFGLVGSIYMLIDDWGTYGGPFACHCKSHSGRCDVRLLMPW